MRIEEPAQYGPALAHALESKTTTVLDVMIEPRAYPPLTLYEGKIKF